MTHIATFLCNNAQIHAYRGCGQMLLSDWRVLSPNHMTRTESSRAKTKRCRKQFILAAFFPLVHLSQLTVDYHKLIYQFCCLSAALKSYTLPHEYPSFSVLIAAQNASFYNFFSLIFSLFLFLFFYSSVLFSPSFHG